LQINQSVLQRNRARYLRFLIFGLLVWLVARLGYWQLIRGPELRDQALAMRLRDLQIEAKRGTIYDRTGRELAVSIDVDSVYAMPGQIRNLTDTASHIARILGLDETWVAERLRRPEAFVWIQRKITASQAAEIRALALRGIGLTQESKRVYPQGSLASHVLGFAGIDSQGLEGIEYQYDAHLRGVPGRIAIEHDARGQEIPQAVHRYHAPSDGLSLVLTIDETIQYICERELAQAVKLYGAQAGTILAMDPRSGEILAMANYPDYDPNNYQAYPAASRRNSAVADMYAPGSTFKPITAAAAVEEGIVAWSDHYICQGSHGVAGRQIGCWERRGHGELSLSGVIEYSCNVGFMLIAEKLGLDKFYDYVQAFGLTRRSGVDLPAEAAGLIIPRSQAKPLDLAVMSFGQSLTVTPLQMLTAMCAIANGGTLVQPHVVKELRDQDGRVIETKVSRTETKVISTQTARELIDSLEQTVLTGTGRRAYIAGFQLAGKTGTSQKVVDGEVSPDRHMSSFIGFGPASDPQVAMLVIIDEPVGTIYGGMVAAPAFSAAMRDIYRYLGIPVTTGQ